jgi:hypothetical protein
MRSRSAAFRQKWLFRAARRTPLRGRGGAVWLKICPGLVPCLPLPSRRPLAKGSSVARVGPGTSEQGFCGSEEVLIPKPSGELLGSRYRRDVGDFVAVNVDLEYREREQLEASELPLPELVYDVLRIRSDRDRSPLVKWIVDAIDRTLPEIGSPSGSVSCS